MKKPKQAKETAWNEISDQVIILGLHDEKKFHELNETGSFLWKSIDGSRSTSDLVNMVAQEFDINEQQASEDLEAFLSELEKDQLIEY